MSDPDEVQLTFACGPGMCDMDVARSETAKRLFIGGAEGEVKVS